ncbi:MAG: hypothetical protein HQK60_19480 [Deltaproteobacteria bacterium]|nr:hypothetical protein [Deltaproteobacteria bacterium]
MEILIIIVCAGVILICLGLKYTPNIRQWLTNRAVKRLTGRIQNAHKACAALKEGDYDTYMELCKTLPDSRYLKKAFKMILHSDQDRHAKITYEATVQSEKGHLFTEFETYILDLELKELKRFRDEARRRYVAELELIKKSEEYITRIQNSNLPDHEKARMTGYVIDKYTKILGY